MLVLAACSLIRESRIFLSFFKLFIKNNYSNDRNIIYKNFTYDNDNDKSSNID